MEAVPEVQETVDFGVSSRRGGPLGRWVRRNPVALKELRGRMRGARAFVVLTIYVGLMSVFAAILYMIYTASASLTSSTTGGVIGKLIFGGVVVIELFLVCFVAPAFTSGAISGEREHRTYYLLRTTLLPARRLVMGKLLSALAYIVLLLLVAVPLQSLAFLMGGVTPEEVLLSVELLLITAIGYGTFGLFASAVTKKTLNASVLTYAFALLMTVALPVVVLIFSGVLSAFLLGVSNLNQPTLELILFYGTNLLGATNPIGAAVMTEIALLQYGQTFVYQQVLSNGMTVTMVSPWITYTVLYLVTSALLLWLTVRRVQRVDT